MPEPVRRRVPVDGGELDVLLGGGDEPRAAAVCTVHPYASMDAALPLLAGLGPGPVVCVNPRGVAGSSPPAGAAGWMLEQVADDLDAVRRALDLERWVLWGMSGGSMAGQVYVHRHPEALDALVLDSAGPCFAVTLQDPDCVGSPFHPRWRGALTAAGLLPAGADAWTGAADLCWDVVAGAGWVCRRAGGPALLVSPDEPPPAMRLSVPSLLAYDARPWLGAVRVPTLVVSGALDQVAPPAQVLALHGLIPGSRFLNVDGAGHVPAGEKPGEVVSAVRAFLAQCCSP